MTPERLRDLAAMLAGTRDLPIRYAIFDQSAVKDFDEAAAALRSYAALLDAKAPAEATGDIAVCIEGMKHWDWCPICRNGLDTGLECESCGADFMPICKAFTGGAVPVVNPQGTGETGNDRPAAPISSAPVEPTGWQPIETAPKKGRFMVWIPATDLAWPAYAAGDWIYSNSHGALNEMQDGRVLKATHWMPLPSAPATVTESPTS